MFETLAESRNPFRHKGDAFFVGENKYAALDINEGCLLVELFGDGADSRQEV